MADIIQMRGDIESNWISKNPILSDRELAFTVDLIPIKMKIGDGYRRWSELNYFAGLKGADGKNGIDGVSPSITVGTVTTGEPNTPVIIINRGTPDNVILDFTIPRGETGQSGSGTGDMLKSVYDTNSNGKVDSIDDNSVNDSTIGNRTLTDSSLLTSYTGQLTTLLNGLLSMQKLVTGKPDGKTAPVTSLESLYNQAEIATLFIPAGITYSPITYAGRNRIYNKIIINCQGENPTSLVITLYHNGTVIYTSPAITTNETTATVNLSITADQTIYVLTSNTTGLTKGVSVSLKQVNR